jgi:uncharacterized protein YjdB
MCWAFVDGYKCGWTQGGIGISSSSESSGLEVDQETDPIITVQTSSTTEITIPLAQWNKRNLELAFPGAVWRGSAGNEYMAVGSVSGAVPHTLRLHPKDKDDDDFSEDFFFPNVTVSTDLDITINKGELQLINLTFNVGPGTPPNAEVAGEKMYYGNVPVGARVAVTGVTLDKESLSLLVNQEAGLKATVAPENATVQTLTWASEDEDVAMVSATEEGCTVYAIEAGTTSITATTKDGAFTGSCAVTVS